MRPHWPWLFWQVIVPLVGPTAVSCVAILIWQSGNPSFVPQWRIALDITPWSLVFYALALTGAALRDLWSQLAHHARLGWPLILTAAFTLSYDAFLTIWRHNSTFVPNRAVYAIAAFVVLLAIGLSHTVTSKLRGH